MTPARRADDTNWFKNHYVLWSFMTGLAGLVAYAFTTFATYAWSNQQHENIKSAYQQRIDSVNEKLALIIDKQKEQDAKIEKLTYYVVSKKNKEE